MEILTMTTTTTAASAEAACSCAGDPNIRILKRVHPLSDYPFAETTEGPVRHVVLVDVETTGTDPMRDEVIDVALITIEVDARGEITGLVNKGEALRDPGMPIPEAITQLTGLTDDDVRGKVIDLDRLERVLAGADVLIAHNCRFDAAFLEDLMPGLAGAAWACSASDFDWVAAGFDGRKLGHLLMQAGYFNDAHRAMADVISLLHLLARRLEDGRTVISVLLENAERPSVRVEATGAPYEKRSLLKARGYHWDPQAKLWWSEVAQVDLDHEVAWIGREITPWGPPPRSTPITWHQRHR